MTRKYVITFTPSTAGNIFGDYSLKFRVTRHSSPLPIVPTRSNISTRYRRVIPLPPIRICLFLEFSQGPEKCGENWAGWQQQRESGNNNEIRSLERRSFRDKAYGILYEILYDFVSLGYDWKYIWKVMNVFLVN